MSELGQEEKLVINIKETLDLDELESKIYLGLLRSGPVTASALAKNLDLDRATMYRVVEKLVHKNIIFTTLSNPRICTAVELRQALKIALEKKQAEIKKIRKSGKAIVEKINFEITSNKETTIPTLRTVQGKVNIYTDIAQMIENCTDTIYIVTTLEDISKMYYSTIPEKIRICKKNGGKVMVLVEVDDMEMIPYVKRFNSTETRICKLPSKGRIAVQKDKQMIMSDSRQTTSDSETDFSISTNAKDMIDNIDDLCRLLWKSAKPLEMVLQTRTFPKK